MRFPAAERAGAFGAGVLVGLTQSGRRPQYEVVTGVSSGALMAPFAFLGPSWDAQLTEAYTGGIAKDVVHPLGIGAAFNAVFGTAIFPNSSLRKLVSHFVTDELVAAVARESATGRRLLVATTDLDREESVIWDLGAIARDGGPRARQLFIDVLVASASVPGAFSPVMIDVRAGGRSYQEMHVDGGAAAPYFVLPNILYAIGYESPALRGANVYLLFNSQLADQPQTTKYNTAHIARRSFTSALNHLTRAALLETRAFARDNQMSFRFTAIPREYPFNGSLEFDPKVMRSLFDFGRRCAAEGKIWVDEKQALVRAEQGLLAGATETPACPITGCGSDRHHGCRAVAGALARRCEFTEDRIAHLGRRNGGLAFRRDVAGAQPFVEGSRRWRPSRASASFVIANE